MFIEHINECMITVWQWRSKIFWRFIWQLSRQHNNYQSHSIMYNNFNYNKPQFRQLHTSFSLQRLVGFEVDHVLMGQGIFQVLQFSPANHHSTNAPYSSITSPDVSDNPYQPDYHNLGLYLWPLPLARLKINKFNSSFNS
jgi:hypothetical protein